MSDGHTVTRGNYAGVVLGTHLSPDVLAQRILEGHPDHRQPGDRHVGADIDQGPHPVWGEFGGRTDRVAAPGMADKDRLRGRGIQNRISTCLERDLGYWGRVRSMAGQVDRTDRMPQILKFRYQIAPAP